MVGRAWLWALNDHIAHGPNWVILAVTSQVQLWPCSAMLRTSVNTLTIHVCDQTQPDVTKDGSACMAGTFVSDLLTCQSKLTKIHSVSFILFFKISDKIIKKKVKRVYHIIITMLSCTFLYGNHRHHRLADIMKMHQNVEIKGQNSIFVLNFKFLVIKLLIY